MNKIITIIDKEWAEVFKNRLVLMSVTLLPLILLALPLFTVNSMKGMEDELTEGIPPEMIETYCQGIDAAQCGMYYILSIYTLLFMILPVMIPVTIAAYSIVGEKTTRSLEPLLATPITSTELLIGKALAAVIPAVIVSWVAYLLYAFGTVFILQQEGVLEFFFAPVWMMAIFIVGPLLTILGVGAAMMISSRVTDPRSAEQLAGLVVLPVILLVVGQSVGLILISRELIFLLGLVVAVLDVVIVYLTIKTFRRETILTQWK